MQLHAGTCLVAILLMHPVNVLAYASGASPCRDSNSNHGTSSAPGFRPSHSICERHCGLNSDSSTVSTLIGILVHSSPLDL